MILMVKMNHPSSKTSNGSNASGPLHEPSWIEHKIPFGWIRLNYLDGRIEIMKKEVLTQAVPLYSAYEPCGPGVSPQGRTGAGPSGLNQRGDRISIDIVSWPTAFMGTTCALVVVSCTIPFPCAAVGWHLLAEDHDSAAAAVCLRLELKERVIPGQDGFGNALAGSRSGVTSALFSKSINSID